MLPNILQSKENQTIKQNIAIEIFSFKNHAENETGRVVPDLFLFFGKALFEVKACILQLSFIYISIVLKLAYNKNKLYEGFGTDNDVFKIYSTIEIKKYFQSILKLFLKCFRNKRFSKQKSKFMLKKRGCLSKNGGHR